MALGKFANIKMISSWWWLYLKTKNVILKDKMANITPFWWLEPCLIDEEE